MLYTIAIVLLILWALGFLAFHVGDGIEGDSARGDWSGPMPGVVRPEQGKEREQPPRPFRRAAAQQVVRRSIDRLDVLVVDARRQLFVVRLEAPHQVRLARGGVGLALRPGRDFVHAHTFRAMLESVELSLSAISLRWRNSPLARSAVVLAAEKY